MYTISTIGQDSHRFADAPPDGAGGGGQRVRTMNMTEGEGQRSLTQDGTGGRLCGTAQGGAECVGQHCSTKNGAKYVGQRSLMLGGVDFGGHPPLDGNSDSDVVLHALCNAISGATGVNILGEVSDRMCMEEGITDSSAYVREAMKHFADGCRIVHASFSIECARPMISPRIMEMRKKIADIIGVDAQNVCITATSGEGLTDFGRGLGIQVFCALTVLIV